MSENSLSVSDADLRKLVLFKSAEFDDVADVLKECSVLRVAAGRIVVAAGQENSRIYLVLNGTLSVRLEGPESPPVAQIGKGEMFGEMSVIDGGETSAFVVTETECHIVGLNGDNLWELLRRTPYVAHNLLKLMAQRLRNANSVIEQLRQEAAGDDFDIEPGG